MLLRHQDWQFLCKEASRIAPPTTPSLAAITGKLIASDEEIPPSLFLSTPPLFLSVWAVRFAHKERLLSEKP